jgi:hypothetical protein
MFTLTIDTSTPAFRENLSLEITSILCDVADFAGYEISEGQTEGPVLDREGNRVGSWAFTPDAAGE